jgi:hypothetical protein
MKKKYLLILLLLGMLHSFSQEKLTNKKYTEYFENTREIPYLHLNKTHFLGGEEIWFQAYIQEQNSQKLHPTTTNLYVSLFNSDRSLKEQKLIHIYNGRGYGSFLLDSTFTGTTYYLKASTKWMKNFHEDQAFYQTVHLVSSKRKSENISLNEDDYFDFQLFPEGGHLISNTINNIGILIKDRKNKGVKIKKGIIRDQNNNIIRQFNTNDFGMNSIRLFIKGNEKYTFQAILSNGSELTATTPLPDNKGITLIVNSKNPKKVAINVISNKKTSDQLIDQEFRILIHNTREYKNFPFKFKLGKLSHTLFIQDEKLSPGMNIITLFNNENQPISERMIFIPSNTRFDDIGISSSYISNIDSLNVNFTNLQNDNVFLSASFLPSNSIAYQPKSNILSSFLLQPYIKGGIQNATKLIANAYKGRHRDLDLLLLTQGWSKYDWHNIFNKPPKDNFTFENGIDVTAKVNQDLTSKQSIVISSKENKLLRVITHEENPWTLKNSLIKKNSTLSFGLNSNNRYYKIAPALSYSGGKIRENIKPISFNNETNFLLEVDNFKPIKSNFETLNEVEVTGIRNRRKTENHEKVFGGMTMYSNARMQNRIIASGETMLDFLKEKGYYDYTTEQIVLRGIGNGGTKLINRDDSENNDNRFGRPLLRIYMDGIELYDYRPIMEQTYLNTVKEIFFGRDPGRLGEQIHIFTLSPSEYSKKFSEFTNIKVPVGFATEKEYYSPKYPSFTNETYQKYGAIHWEPNIVIQGDSKRTIKIPANLQENINIYIEGITTSGKLISQKVILKTK